MTRTKLLSATAAFAACAVFAAPAAAKVEKVLGSVPCVQQEDGRTTCSGLATTFDGAPIDVNVTLPASGEAPYPLIGIYHGWGGSKVSLDAEKRWADRGYAVFSMSDRGWGGSCGGTSANRTSPECSSGYNHLMDTRYEVRDSQELIARLADENLADPKHVGATGGSYGGGLSMALGALRNRKMLPDGQLVPWRSPMGKRMRIAAVAPEIPWTDMAYSLVPNGRTLDYVADASYGRNHGGIAKTSYIAGLYATGKATSNYAPPGTDEDADLDKWFVTTFAGEPYDGNPLLLDALDELTTHHSSYYIDHSVAPAPLLISNGWTDDLFPVDEALRFYNRTRSQFGKKAKVGLQFLDYGHARGQGKTADTALLRARQDAWFDWYLKGEGDEPFQGVTVTTTTCPKAAASGGPFSAPTWKDLAPGEVRFESAAQQVIATGGDPQAGRAFDPIAGGGACATADGADFPGTAAYRLPTGEFTLMGAPTVIADVLAPSPASQIAARLLDVAPDGSATLVARGLYRPDSGVAATRQVFQLHPQGWHFAQDHVAKLELLASDAPYGRVSNGQAPIAVSNLELRLPALERPGGAIKEPAAKVVPEGYELAADYKPKKPRKAKTRRR